LTDKKKSFRGKTDKMCPSGGEALSKKKRKIGMSHHLAQCWRREKEKRLAKD